MGGWKERRGDGGWEGDGGGQRGEGRHYPVFQVLGMIARRDRHLGLICVMGVQRPSACPRRRRRRAREPLAAAALVGLAGTDFASLPPLMKVVVMKSKLYFLFSDAKNTPRSRNWTTKLLVALKTMDFWCMINVARRDWRIEGVLLSPAGEQFIMRTDSHHIKSIYDRCH